jgi:integrase
MMYHHGLRVSEAIGLRRDDVDLDQARLWVRRLKNGLAGWPSNSRGSERVSGTHP